MCCRVLNNENGVRRSRHHLCRTLTSPVDWPTTKNKCLFASKMVPAKAKKYQVQKPSKTTSIFLAFLVLVGTLLGLGARWLTTPHVSPQEKNLDGSSTSRRRRRFTLCMKHLIVGSRLGGPFEVGSLGRRFDGYGEGP